MLCSLHLQGRRYGQRVRIVSRSFLILSLPLETCPVHRIVSSSWNISYPEGHLVTSCPDIVLPYIHSNTAVHWLRYVMDSRGIVVRRPAVARDSSLLCGVQTGSGCSQPRIQCVPETLSSVAKRPRRETVQSTQSSA